MAPYDLDAFQTGDQAYRIAMNGFVALLSATDDTERWLDKRGYRIARLDAAGWHTQADFHRDIKAALDFPEYYGNNLDAFNDCLRDLATYAYGASPSDAGTVLVFANYEAFNRRDPRAAHAILDIVATQARTGALFGHRMLGLVQSNDPDLSFAPVGGTPVQWYAR